MVFWYLDYANFNSTGMRLGDMSVSSGLGQRLLKLRFKSVIDIILLSYSYIQKLGLSLDCDSIEFSIARGLWHLLHGLLQLVLSERPLAQCIVPVCEMVANVKLMICQIGRTSYGDISLEKNTGSDTEEEDK
ncbi:unnamed protein product, partial [Brassica oleracea var. botrytis]